MVIGQSAGQTVMKLNHPHVLAFRVENSCDVFVMLTEVFKPRTRLAGLDSSVQLHRVKGDGAAEGRGQ